jgi:hypothetical protein
MLRDMSNVTLPSRKYAQTMLTRLCNMSPCITTTDWYPVRCNLPRDMVPAAYVLQVTCYRLHVTGYMLQVTGYMLQVTGPLSCMSLLCLNVQNISDLSDVPKYVQPSSKMACALEGSCIRLVTCALANDSCNTIINRNRLSKGNDIRKLILY